ncbi:hypothetical protein DMC30DRAFT_418350 [Rhodotorula diobovata]|uniref:MARVEL domain-containing protein n=1 Tax=Rhodotorula diobovata TaxID=5288 RepID=A0A5C5FQN7_9BASI|nr:hypothetical protein DMC30DRAFT_418350 [Rhodotorula diobovata]
MSSLPSPFSVSGIEGKSDGDVLSGPDDAPRAGARRVDGRGKWWDDEDGNSPLGLALRILETFFPFVNLCIFISQAAFQAKWDVGISGRVGVSLFFCIEAFAHGGLVLATFFLADKLRFLRPLERGLKQIRVAVILEVFQVVCMLLMALVQSVSANVGGCKDPTKDGNADLEGYVDALPGFCRDKRASAAFFWLNFFAWSVSLALTFLTFARVRRNPRSTGFAPPGAHFPQDDDEAWARPSFDEGGAAAAPGEHAYAPAHASSAPGYRPSHDYAEGGERLFDEPGMASGYGRRVATTKYAETSGRVDEEPLRDPFEDQGYGEGASGGRYGGIEDPYEAIRKSMDVHGHR